MSGTDTPERRPSIIERAYQLARSGRCSRVEDIRRILVSERYDSVQAHLSGMSIRRALAALCHDAAALPGPSPSIQRN